jgi:hypothetical protein
MADASHSLMRAHSALRARPQAPVTTTSPGSTKHLLDAFLVTVYRRATKAEHAKPTPLSEIANELELSEGLSEKVAEFLESQGLIDYDDQAVDITIPGMIRSEDILAPRTVRNGGSRPKLVKV